jgi:S-adenosylmethionine:tRNA ribosyltransferase-isomerase
MNQPQEIRIESFNYPLLDKQIAKYPVSERDTSKLLIYNKGKISTNQFLNIDAHIPENSLLLYNNTKVIYARLFFKKASGAKIEIFCLEPIQPKPYEEMFSSKQTCTWKCIVGNLKKWKENILEKDIRINGQHIKLLAKQIERNGQDVIIQFEWTNGICFSDILESEGNIPIPPYLKRKSEPIDKKRYQTVYADIKGSVAAPTAGLHFTPRTFELLQKKNIHINPLTLHVGAGTFQPVKTDTIGAHQMHTEHFVVSRQNLELIKKYLGNITNVGTTTLRTLESLYWLSLHIANKNTSVLHVNQWDPYEAQTSISPQESIEILLNYLNQNNIEQLNASTDIIIVPGYKFKFTNRLITNFHQPKSTLLLLVAAFIDSDWKKVYQYALENDYRFLSYGDSSLLIP